ncbi:germination protein, Ger(x)C family [Alkalithermobacter thermoalcaliphilus JW-YL-7 = DSM 7308]|uniref:Germination protein, Ger(X)C family n=1 Tax=Alkalithermobacter thermoalcaliphilus JW-YL-7 = DSM 7308 TaxID=1121328 RepID=A0A150FMN8_CLOPD|nr:germination protein, Ger(x)C family [[Clostridium] paradoxum JW-YL-7 = DSM 7308]SHL21927.1 germination protein, Ger(x)C family [[Clostridium] paradoxum JW-YL-7 = DSM 7308]
MNKILIFILIMVNTFMLSGCWDKVEIDERGFVLVIGVDKVTEEEKQSEKDRIKVSLKVPNVGLISGKSELGTESSFYYEEIGSNLSFTIEKITAKAPFNITLDHTKVIVFGKSLLQDSHTLIEVLDGIERDSRFSRKMIFVGAEKYATDILKLEPKENPLVGIYLKSILDLEIKEGRAIDGNLNKIMYQIHESGSSIWPYIRVSEDKRGIEIMGAYVLRDNELIGELSYKEAVRFNALTKKTQEVGEIDIIYEGILTSYEVYNTKNSFKVDVEDNNLVLNIKIETEGDIVQHKIGIIGLTLDDKAIQEMEKMIERKIEERFMGVITKLQKEFETDVLGVRIYLKKYNPKFYKQIEDNFNDYFSAMKVNLEIDSKIRRVGIVK